MHGRKIDFIVLISILQACLSFNILIDAFNGPCSPLYTHKKDSSVRILERLEFLTSDFEVRGLNLARRRVTL